MQKKASNKHSRGGSKKPSSRQPRDGSKKPSSRQSRDGSKKLSISKSRDGSNKPSGQEPRSGSSKLSVTKKNPRADKAKPKARASAPTKLAGSRLNKYISNAGICSRREADVLIQTGIIEVNGKIVTELGARVMPGDIVKYDGATIRQEKLRYVLLNKPKNYITTMDDPQKRRTVMLLTQEACKERIYPVGRLDRNTTGLLLLTNDGDLAKKLTHPKHHIQKLYSVVTAQKVETKHLHAMRHGVELEDGIMKADEIDYVGDGKDHHKIGVSIHSGRNRIVRRMFEHFGYTVSKLDRTIFAGLTKKDLPKGRFRHLTEKEVAFLKML
jgi:23S rRNA pseudouridine2605 synthase